LRAAVVSAGGVAMNVAEERTKIRLNGLHGRGRAVEAFCRLVRRSAHERTGSSDLLFTWLATTASLDEMKWLIEQEVAGEAGFDDLVALTQVKMSGANCSRPWPRSMSSFRTEAGFSVGIVLTTPPFPYPRPQGLKLRTVGGCPSCSTANSPAEDRRHMYYCEVGLEDGELVTTGIYGWVMVVTGVGATISWRGPIVWRSGCCSESAFPSGYRRATDFRRLGASGKARIAHAA